MTDINEIYTGGNFVKTSDIPKGTGLEVTITNIQVQKIGNKPDEKPKLVLDLDNKKQFPCNKTNAKRLAIVFGTTNFEQWVGKKFKIKRDLTEYSGETTECMRVAVD